MCFKTKPVSGSIVNDPFQRLCDLLTIPFLVLPRKYSEPECLKTFTEPPVSVK